MLLGLIAFPIIALFVALGIRNHLRERERRERRRKRRLENIAHAEAWAGVMKRPTQRLQTYDASSAQLPTTTPLVAEEGLTHREEKGGSRT